MRRPELALACLAFLVPAAPARAAEAPPPCAAAEYRQFDFWLGRWEVTSPEGRPQGTNEITRAFGDCVLRERWMSASGHPGESLNSYDRTRGVWHQTWVDAQGTLLLLEGGLSGDRMVLEGSQRGPGGKRVLQRITWTPKSKDEVHQHWQTSPDSGATWTTAFLGVYRRAGD